MYWPKEQSTQKNWESIVLLGVLLSGASDSRSNIAMSPFTNSSSLSHSPFSASSSFGLVLCEEFSPSLALPFHHL